MQDIDGTCNNFDGATSVSVHWVLGRHGSVCVGGVSDWDLECLTQQSLEDLQTLSDQLSDDSLTEQQRRHLAQVGRLLF